MQLLNPKYDTPTSVEMHLSLSCDNLNHPGPSQMCIIKCAVEILSEPLTKTTMTNIGTSGRRSSQSAFAGSTDNDVSSHYKRHHYFFFIFFSPSQPFLIEAVLVSKKNP